MKKQTIIDALGKLHILSSNHSTYSPADFLNDQTEIERIIYTHLELLASEGEAVPKQSETRKGFYCDLEKRTKGEVKCVDQCEKCRQQKPDG